MKKRQSSATAVIDSPFSVREVVVVAVDARARAADRVVAAAARAGVGDLVEPASAPTKASSSTVEPALLGRLERQHHPAGDRGVVVADRRDVVAPRAEYGLRARAMKSIAFCAVPDRRLFEKS